VKLDLENSFSCRELAAALTNGDVDLPEYLHIAESSDHLKIWDEEEGGSSQMGFTYISYTDE